MPVCRFNLSQTLAECNAGYGLANEQLKIKFMQIGRLFACMVLKAEALEAKISTRMEKSRDVSFYYSAFFFLFHSSLNGFRSGLRFEWSRTPVIMYLNPWALWVVYIQIGAATFEVEEKGEKNPTENGISELCGHDECECFTVDFIVLFPLFFVSLLFACRHSRTLDNKLPSWQRWCAMSYH